MSFGVTSLTTSTEISLDWSTCEEEKRPEKMLARFVPKFRLPKVPVSVQNLPEVLLVQKYGQKALSQLPKIATWGLPAAVFGMFPQFN